MTSPCISIAIHPLEAKAGSPLTCRHPICVQCENVDGGVYTLSVHNMLGRGEGGERENPGACRRRVCAPWTCGSSTYARSTPPLLSVLTCFIELWLPRLAASAATAAAELQLQWCAASPRDCCLRPGTCPSHTSVAISVLRRYGTLACCRMWCNNTSLTWIRERVSR